MVNEVKEDEQNLFSQKDICDGIDALLGLQTKIPEKPKKFPALLSFLGKTNPPSQNIGGIQAEE